MTRTRRTVVIGGGLIGVTTAWELVDRGESVTLVEAANDLAAGTSHANAGLLTASMSDPWNSPGVATHLLKSLFDPNAATKLRIKAIPGLAGWGLGFLRESGAARFRETTHRNYRLADFSVRETLQLAERLSLEFDQSEIGTLKIFGSQRAAETALALSESMRPLGVEFERLTVDGVVRLEPELAGSADRIACGIHYGNDAAGDARMFTRSLGEHARRAGVDVRTGCRVTEIRCTGGKVTSVATDADELAADRIVLATGPRSPELARPLGVSIPVRPAKGYSVTIHMTTWPSRPTLPVVDDAMHVGIVPIGNRLRVAGTAEFTGFDATLSPERIDNLYTLVGRVYPDLAPRIDRSTAAPWTGFRPMSATGRPIIAPAGPEGLWINTGHGHLGWTMAVGSAKLLVAQMLGDAPPIETAPFRLP